VSKPVPSVYKTFSWLLRILLIRSNQKAAKERIASLEADIEQTLEQTQQKAARDLAASRREGAESAAYIRKLFTKFSELGGQQTDRGTLLGLPDEELRFRISKADLPEGQLPSLDRESDWGNRAAQSSKTCR
jgi:hypothetical protein